MWSAVVTGANVYSPSDSTSRSRTHTRRPRSRPEQLSRDTPDLHSIEKDSNIRNQGEHEDHRPGVQQHSEAAPERTLGSGQDAGDADDLTRSGKSRGNLTVQVTLWSALTPTR